MTKAHVFVRSFSQDEQLALEAGAHSKDLFICYRSQVLLASRQGRSPKAIARLVGCSSTAVRNAIHGFNARGLDSLRQGLPGPKQKRSH